MSARVIPRSWLPKRKLNLDMNINGAICEIFTSNKPWVLFKPTRPRAKFQAAGRKAGNTRMVMALCERLGI